MASYSGGGMCSVKIRQSEKEIEKIKAELEQKKKAVMEEITTAHVPEYESFSKNVDNVEEGLRSNTVGLVTLSQMKEKQRLAVEERERQIALKLAEDKVSQVLNSPTCLKT
jgi:protein FAM50